MLDVRRGRVIKDPLDWGLDACREGLVHHLAVVDDVQVYDRRRSERAQRFAIQLRLVGQDLRRGVVGCRDNHRVEREGATARAQM